MSEFVVNDILGPNDTPLVLTGQTSKQGTGPVFKAPCHKHDYAGLIHRMKSLDPSLY